MFRVITDRLGMPGVDMFASRLNHMVPQFFSWRLDPACEAVNASSQSWHGVVGYAFPPFNLLGRVKIVRDQTTAMLIFPFWPTQPWFPLIADVLVDLPLGLPSSESLLWCPGRPDCVHPLLPSLQLIVGVLSTDDCRQWAFRQQQSTSLQLVGSHPQPAIIHPLSENGMGFVARSGWIPVVSTLIAFLTHLFNKGIGFFLINTARSAISVLYSLSGPHRALSFPAAFQRIGLPEAG